jgi:hypothetical protein
MLKIFGMMESIHSKDINDPENAMKKIHIKKALKNGIVGVLGGYTQTIDSMGM